MTHNDEPDPASDSPRHVLRFGSTGAGGPDSICNREGCLPFQSF